MNNTTSAVPEWAAAKLALVVDDDSFSRELFTEMLLALGITDTHTADTGRKALRVLAALPRQPDLVICDVFMPDMDGIEFLDTLASQGYTGDIILVSGQDIDMMAIAREMAISQGLQLLGAFTKPVTQAVLALALAQASA
jgi:CheY-like chemotaxis protein